MLDGMTALGFMAAHSNRARIGLMVGGIHYRPPGLWIKAHTTLDVLSGGRAWFGIGAAWNEEESRGLGFPMPPLRERFEWLEDTLQMAYGMWSGGSGSGERFEGRHATATRLLNSPQSISRPRVPIIYAFTEDPVVLRQMALNYATRAHLLKLQDDSEQMLSEAFAVLCREEGFTPGDQVVVLSDVIAAPGVEAIQVRAL